MMQAYSNSEPKFSLLTVLSLIHQGTQAGTPVTQEAILGVGAMMPNELPYAFDLADGLPRTALQQ